MLNAAQSAGAATPRMLNLGCGETFHPDWINMDFHDHGGRVTAYDLRLGIPLPDGSVDVVYHSHVLEHFSRDEGARFMAECYRVLRPGGLLRAAVPDLENIMRAYLDALTQARSGSPEGLERHEWMVIEGIDQMVRERSGGEMLAYWKRDPMPQQAFVFARAGQEAVRAIERLRAAGQCGVTQKQNMFAPPLSVPDQAFAASGERHRWMYDEVSLSTLLQRVGFADIARRPHDASAQPALLAYGLDTAPDGSVRKPDSLFMEARKPLAASAPQPLVAIFSAADSGGAGIAALRLHQALQAAGEQSQMYVGTQQHSAARVHLAPGSRQGVLCDQGGHAVLATYQAGHQDLARQLARYPGRPRGSEYFSQPRQSFAMGATPWYNDFAVINFHWVAGLADPALCVDALKGRPVVWTLHDMNPFTGGCHYAGGCTRFMEHCGQCPQLGSSDTDDLSLRTWRSRMAAYRQLDLHIVCPSRWMAEEAKKSSLLGRFPVHVIANPLPTDLFRPLKREGLRAEMGMAADDLVLAFSAHDLDNARKGLHSLIESLRLLAQSPLRRKIRLLLLGSNPPDVFLQLGFRVDVTGRVTDPERMALLYNAADAVLVPSREDNLPNVICEAAGCGVPVVAFAVGGIPEMVRHEETGWLAAGGDPAALAQGIAWVDDARKDPALRLRCRTFALEQWNPADRAREYAQLFAALRQRGADHGGTPPAHNV